jgi:hypothetical protein
MHWWWIVLAVWLAGSVPVSMLTGWWLRNGVARVHSLADRDASRDFERAPRRRARVPVAQSR